MPIASQQLLLTQSKEKHDEASLRKIFSQCGMISHLLLGKKGKSALLVFDSPYDAVPVVVLTRLLVSILRSHAIAQ